MQASPCAHAERLIGAVLDRVDALMYFPSGAREPHNGPIIARIFAGETSLAFACRSDGSVEAALDEHHHDVGTVLPDGATMQWMTWRQFAGGGGSMVENVRTLADETGPYGCALELRDGSIVELRNEGDDLALGFMTAHDLGEPSSSSQP